MTLTFDLALVKRLTLNTAATAADITDPDTILMYDTTSSSVLKVSFAVLVEAIATALAATPKPGVFTTLQATSTVTFTPANNSLNFSPTGTGVVAINPAAQGSINNMSVGQTTPRAVNSSSFKNIINGNGTGVTTPVEYNTNGYSNGDQVLQNWTSGASTSVGKFGVSFSSGQSSFVWKDLYNGGATSATYMSLGILGLTVTGRFGCNGSTAQAAAGSGAALGTYATGAFGLDSSANMSALHAKVKAIDAALKANGICS